MNILLLGVIILIGSILLLIAVVALMSKYYFTKWRRVYDFVYEGMTYVNQDNDYGEIVILKQILQEDFDLTSDEAEECLFNWKDKNWFKKQEFLKNKQNEN